MRLEIAAPPAYRRLERALRKHLPAARQLIRSRVAEISIALVGNDKMAKLHRDYLNLPGPTDVLTFELEHDRNQRVIAGEVVICVPKARVRARQARTRLEDEVLLYAIHGLLHLSGFDDRTDPEFKAMHRCEDRILAALGIGPVFNPIPRKPTPRAD